MPEELTAPEGEAEWQSDETGWQFETAPSQEEPTAPEEEAEERFETTPEQATAMGGGAQQPGLFNRKKLLIALCISFSVIIGGGLVFNALKPSKKNAAAESGATASNTSTEFLSSLQNRSLRQRASETGAGADSAMENILQEGQLAAPAPEPLLPTVSFNMAPEPVPAPATAPQPQTPTPPAAPQPTQQPAQPAAPQQPTYFRSPLIPQVQGSLFAGQATQGVSGNIAANTQAAQGASAAGGIAANANAPGYGQPDAGGMAYNGRYLGENALWAGTVIPGVLETAINTDLPGNVLARVTQNIYDSQTGQSLLIPQGTLLIARYGSSVSYAQSRVQIAWDTMIRPDGFQTDLGGAGGIDRQGMSGLPAKTDEHWFEYLKAAGIVTLFSIANASMTETAAKYATGASAANIAEANSGLVSQLGGSLVSRAMDIQPTLTVENGTPINIMLNATIYLPPLPAVQAAQKYRLE